MCGANAAALSRGVDVNIGILGGTFDPPHNGHIAIADQARNQLGLDVVYFVPTFIPPHKRQQSATSAQHRMAMLKLAVHGRTEFIVSPMELMRGGISYTVDTLRSFRDRFPKDKFVLIIGADNLVQFNSWKSPKTILQLASLAVYRREGFNASLKESDLDFIVLKGRMYPISSTEVRNRIEAGRSVRAMVPASIVSYINRYSLYTTPKPLSIKRLFHENHRAV